MNNRQKRLCRALLDFYDASGAQPYPLAQLARKTGYDASDIYDKDSQSGDLWPFDPKARGNLAGMLSFASGKNPTVSITSAGLVALEKLCQEEPAVARKAPAAVTEENTSEPYKPVAAAHEKASETPKLVPPPSRRLSSPPRFVPPPSRSFSSEDITDARARFKQWLESDEGRKMLFDRLEGDGLVEAAFDRFFGEFLQGKDS